MMARVVDPRQAFDYERMADDDGVNRSRMLTGTVFVDLVFKVMIFVLLVMILAKVW